jgi:hypothetical protein
MKPFLRIALAALALLMSGAVQLAAATGEAACCEEEQGSTAPECPPGIACACCPTRGALETAELDVAPAASPGVAVMVVAVEPKPGASTSDIFQPPRA